MVIVVVHSAAMTVMTTWQCYFL